MKANEGLNMICPNCGNTIPKGSKKCPMCNLELTTEDLNNAQMMICDDNKDSF